MTALLRLAYHFTHNVLFEMDFQNKFEIYNKYFKTIINLKTGTLSGGIACLAVRCNQKVIICI